MDATAERLHRERGQVVDAFARAEELIAEAKRLGLNAGPFEVQVAERLCIRLLVKHFGWTHGDPHTLRRVK